MMDFKVPPKVKKVFIVANRRSGTTWLTMLLSRHPQVVGLQQSSFFWHLNRFASYFNTDAPYARHILTAAAGDAGGAVGLDRQVVSSVVSIEDMYRYLRPLAENVYAHLAESHENIRVMIDHQPENIDSWEHILEIFPDACFLNVVRDPRSVFSSFSHAARSWSNRDAFTCNPIDFARKWNDAVAAGRSIAKATDDYYEISYECLCRESASELGKLHEYLGLPTSPEKCQADVEACTVDKLQKSGFGPEQFFRKGQVDGWRRELSRSEIAIIEYLCSELMEEYSYEFAAGGKGKAPLAFHSRTFRERIKAKLLRIAHRYLS